MFGLGMQEILIVLILVLIVFGAKRLPEIGGALGKAIQNFKRASDPDEVDITPNKEKTQSAENTSGSTTTNANDTTKV